MNRPPLPFTILLVGENPAAWDVIQEAEQTLAAFEVPTTRVPDSFVTQAADWLPTVGVAVCAVIVASAGGGLPADWAKASRQPTLRVPVAPAKQPLLASLQDARGQLPAGSGGAEFATMAVGTAGAKNAALFVVSMLSLADPALRERWQDFRTRQTATVLEGPALKLED